MDNLLICIFFIITISLILIGFVLNYNKINDEMKIEKFIDKHYKIIVFLIFFIVLFTSLYKLGIVPYGMHVDEAGMAYDALSLSKYGVDRYLNKFPVYLINYGGGQSAMYAYLTAILIKIFGYSIYIIRMPAVLLRFLLVISGFLIVKENKSKYQSLIFILLLAITPYFIMQSRWGLDCNLLVGFLTISIYFLIKAINKKSNKLFIISGIFFGLTLYTYALSYIIVPLFLLLTLIYLLYIKKINLKEIIIFGIPIFLLSIPLILMILVNNGIINEIDSFITIPKMISYRGAEISLLNIFKNGYIYKSIISYDNAKVFGNILVYNSLPQFGTIYYMLIPFLIIGILIGIVSLYKSIKNKVFNIDAIMIFWFLSVMICMMLIIEPNINKANAIFLPIIYFVSLGIFYTIKNIKLLIIFLIMLFINFGLFFNYYFYHYNSDNMD